MTDCSDCGHSAAHHLGEKHPHPSKDKVEDPGGCVYFKGCDCGNTFEDVHYGDDR